MRVRVIVLYCLVVYAISWSLQFVAIHTTVNLESDAATPWLAGVMFSPALIALLFTWKIPSARGVLLWKPTWSMMPYIFVAVTVPTFVAFELREGQIAVSSDQFYSVIALAEPELDAQALRGVLDELLSNLSSVEE